MNKSNTLPTNLQVTSSAKSLNCKIKEVNRVNTITKKDYSIVQLDRPKLNSGQLIHFTTPEKEIRVNKDKALEGIKEVQKDYISNVEKKTVKNVLVVDWFETTLLTGIKCSISLFNTTDSSIEVGNRLVFHNEYKSTNLFHNTWSVIYDSELIGRLLTNGKTKKVKVTQVQFKLDNPLLYTTNWLTKYKEVLSLVGWTHLSLTRLDIALDGQAPTNVLGLTEKVHKGSRVIGRKGKAQITTSQQPNTKITRWHIGSTQSDKNGTIYPKSEYIKRSGKTYVSDYWKANNLVDLEDVKRFEIRLRAKKANAYDWTKLDDVDYLASILKTECKNWLEFYYKGKDSNKYRAYNSGGCNWIDWDSIGGELLDKLPKDEPSKILKAKRLIKQLEYFDCVDGLSIPRTKINEYLDRYDLRDWYYKRIEDWLCEFDREIQRNKLLKSA